MRDDWRPDLKDNSTVLALPPRYSAYYNIIEYCRHIGVEVKSDETSFWVARVRTQKGGYKMGRLGPAKKAGVLMIDFKQAFAMATLWFETPEVTCVSADPYPVGSKRTMNICPIGDDYTIGHALQAYLDWKLLAATNSHYETMVSMINYHLVPRISNVLINHFDGAAFQSLAVDVLETPPKYGREVPNTRNRIQNLSQEELRKRKKTFNSLVSILRGTFELAYERGHLDSDRSICSLRRLPNIDRPRVVFLDREQCRTLLKACHPDIRPLTLAALYTGCRAAELIAMRVGDFSTHTRSVYVASPKGRRTRYVFLPPEAMIFFGRLTLGRTASDRMFRKANGRIWGGEYKAYFQKARTMAGLTSALTFHGLRHTYASQLLQNGASIVTVADQLGHANTQTVSSTYGHLTSQSRSADIDRCFTTIVMTGENHADDFPLSEGDRTCVDLPIFKRRTNSSWPLSNHSRFSGSLLGQLKPEEIESEMSYQ